MTTPQPQDLTVALVAMLLVGAGTLAVVPTAAADDHGLIRGPIDRLQDSGVAFSEDPIEAAQQTAAAVSAWAQGAATRVTGVGASDESETVAETSADLRAVVNDNSASFERYVNARVDATADRDVVAVTLDGDTENTTYVTADVQNESYTNLSAVGTTDRDVDVECTLSGDLATRADDELERFHSEFVSDDENVSAAFVSRMGARYDGSLGGLCEGA